MAGQPRWAVIEDASGVFASQRRIPTRHAGCSPCAAMTRAILRSLTIEIGDDARAVHSEAGLLTVTDWQDDSVPDRRLWILHQARAHRGKRAQNRKLGVAVMDSGSSEMRGPPMTTWVWSGTSMSPC
jgi:hypothetical protein